MSKYLNKGTWISILRIIRTLPVRLKIRKIGKLSTIVSPVFIWNGKRVFIANGVGIYPGCRIETHNGGTIVIEKNTNIGQNFHITSAEQELRIGKNTTISGNVCITNIDHEYREIGKHILQQSLIVHKTQIGENCFIGFGAVIQAGTILGQQCIVGANAVVRGTFPDYCVIAGVPAKIVKKYNALTQEWEKI